MPISSGSTIQTASAVPACAHWVALSALPIAWTAAASLSFLAGAAPWLDTRLALAPLHHEVLSATQWAHAGTALALWMLLPLLIGIWRITRAEVAS